MTKNTKVICISLEKELIEKILEIQKKEYLNRSKMISRLIRRAIQNEYG